MNKDLNIISAICCVITLTFLYIYNAIIGGFHYNGVVILMLLFMCLNPIANLCRINKKIINNPIYHIVVVALSIYISIITIKGINISINSNLLNESIIYFYNNLLIMLIATIFTCMLSFVLKKEKIESHTDNSKLMIILILITSILPFISDSTSYERIFSFTQFVFGIITLIKLYNIGHTDELRGYYLATFIIGILACNPIAIVLSAYTFTQVDKFGLMI